MARMTLIEIEAVTKRLLPVCIVAHKLKARIENSTGSEYVEGLAVDIPEGAQILILELDYETKGFNGEINHLKSAIDFGEGPIAIFKMITDFTWYVHRASRDLMMHNFLDIDTPKKIHGLTEDTGVH